MIRGQLLLKYRNAYICEQISGEIDFIQLPHYSPSQDDFSCYQDARIFITLLLSGNIDCNYGAICSYDYLTWLSLFQKYFVPKFFYQIDEGIYFYDIDACNLEDLNSFDSTLKMFSNRLVCKDVSELKKNREIVIADNEKNIFNSEPYKYDVNGRVNPELLNFIERSYRERTERDVLLLYSGGRDSTLSAIRLKNRGYHVHFLHFDNGSMLDADKPYLTYKKIFSMDQSFSFPYSFSNLDVSTLFYDYYFPWRIENGDDYHHATLTSEIRCLSCRLAMYTKAFEVALQGNFKILAEGARISQKFMIEQVPMITQLKELAKECGLDLLFPVLELQDDQEEIRELLQFGYSSKTWEAKCLIGRKPKDKTPEDEKIILDYYQSVIKPKILEKVKSNRRINEISL